MERERTLVTGLIILLLGLWALVFVHQSPRFPGSVLGGVLGVAAALCMLVPLAYTLVKRVSWVKTVLDNPRVQSRLLTLHVYTSLAGAFLAMLHSGHKFQSWLGIALMTFMLLSVLSGYVGRHFLRYVSLEIAEQQRTLTALKATYDELAKIALSRGIAPSADSLMGRLRKDLAALIAGPSPSGERDLGRDVARVVDAMADMEYAIQANETIKRNLRFWLGVHIATSVVFYTLLLLHIAASIQFGLRWFS